MSAEMTQNTMTVQPNRNTTSIQVSVEVVVYVVLILFALLLRLAELNTVPMTVVEVPQALATWKAVAPSAPVEPTIPSSPILFWMQHIAFSTIGGNEFAARIMTAVGGVLLTLTPLLFRSYFGAGKTLLLTFLLVISPIAFVASRFGSPVVWTMLLAILGLWMLWRYWQSGKTSDALWGGVFFSSMLFLSEAAGIWLGVILVISVVLALSRTLLTTSESNESNGDSLTQVQARVRSLPWLSLMGGGGFVLLIVSTGFMLYPAGLGSVGAVIGNALGGFLQTAEPEFFRGIPVVVLLVYQPLLVLFALITIIRRIRQQSIRFIDSFLIIWLVLLGVFAFVYPALMTAHALFFVIPLAVLASDSIFGLLDNRLTLFYQWQQDSEDNPHLMERWGKWVLGIIVFALLTMVIVHLQVVGKYVGTLPQGDFFTQLRAVAENDLYVHFRNSLVWIIVIVLMIVIGGFLFASFWGEKNALKGLGLGLFMFMLVADLAVGWNAAVVQSDNPYELWHSTATSSDAPLLRETLLEIAGRDTEGFPFLDVTVLVDEENAETGILAWQLRDFINTRFTDLLTEAQRDQIVIATHTDTPPDLQGSYVGQSFVIERAWDVRNLDINDFVKWFTQRQVLISTLDENVVTLWLRQDVYDSIPVDQRPSG